MAVLGIGAYGDPENPSLRREEYEDKISAEPESPTHPPAKTAPAATDKDKATPEGETSEQA